MNIEIVLIIYDGLEWLARYEYIIDGHKWDDLNDFNTIISKPGKLDYTKGWRQTHPPLELRV